MAACRVTPPANLGDAFTIARSLTPLNCLLILSGPSDLARITAATSLNLANGQSTVLTIPATGLSFQIPVDVVGNFDINVTLNRQLGPLEVVVEDCDAKTPLLTIASKGGNFVLKVN